MPVIDIGQAETQGSAIKVIDKAVVILRAMAASDEARPLRDIAAATGLSKSTSRRILLALVQNGFCEEAGSGTYRLGLGLFELGMRVQARFEVRARAAPWSKRLATTMRATVFLLVKQGDHAVCIDRADGGDVYSRALPVGGTRLLHVGAAAQVLLAFQPDQVINEYVANLEHARSERGKLKSPTEILRIVAKCRKDGFFVAENEVTPGIAAIGAPIFEHTGAIVAAISVSATSAQIKTLIREGAIETVLDTAAAISKDLGNGGGLGEARRKVNEG
jgi:DNA-binding IclR family transcriptional regulator